MTWAGAGQTLTLLLAFAMIWALAAWSGSTVRLNQPSVQPQVIGTMAGSLLLAAVVSDAYGTRGLLFAITYVLIHVGSCFYHLTMDRHGPAAVQSRRVVLWEGIAGIGWISGGLLTGTARGVLWAVAIATEYVGAALGWPAPRLGSTRHRKRRLAGERVSERYRQFVIIALGASLFVAGRAFSDAKTHPVGRTWALVVVFVITVLMWRIYIYRAGELMTEAIVRAADPSQLSQFAAVTHLIMVAGIVCTASASEFAIENPFDDTPPAWAATILGGPALFLVGRGLLDYAVFGRVSRSRLAGLVMLGAVAPTIHLLPLIATALIVMIILLLIAVLNLITNRTRPLAPAPPALG